MVYLNDAKKLLKDYAQDLTFEEAFGFILVKPRAYLGSERFGKIAALVRDADGEYVSAGKESHFRLPGEKPEQAHEKPGKLTQTKLVEQGIALIEQGLAKFKEAYKHA